MPRACSPGTLKPDCLLVPDAVQSYTIEERRCNDPINNLLIDPVDEALRNREYKDFS